VGDEAVRRYYQWQLLGPHNVTALGADFNQTIVGFCFGGQFRGAMSGYVAKNRAYLLLSLLFRPWIFVKPSVLRRIKGLFSQYMQSLQARPGEAGSSQEVPDYFGILAIAVLPEFQSRGVGKQLMWHAEMAARKQGDPRMRLVVNADNLQAFRFYQSIGWEVITTVKSRGVSVMQKELSEGEG
ncbi:MAG: GNAT family N-acetyltransferase, partial [Anaerolineales bacterium]|nr:GNAT family N-acetyltransferase [Anaerolineales bacterium]